MRARAQARRSMADGAELRPEHLPPAVVARPKPPREGAPALRSMVDEVEREALHDAIGRSWSSVQAGRGRDAQDVLAALRTRR